MIKCCYRKKNKAVDYGLWHQDYSRLYLSFFYKFIYSRSSINSGSILRSVWKNYRNIATDSLLVAHIASALINRKVLLPGQFIANLSDESAKKKKKRKRKEEESKETKLLIIIIIIIITTTTTTIILSYWNTVELRPSDKQTLHFNLPKATTVPTETHLSLTGGSTDCIKLTKKVLSIENPKLKANISSKSLGLHQRCELTGCVAEKLWIPKRGLLYCKLLVGPQNVRVQGGGSRQKVNIGLCGYLLWVLEFFYTKCINVYEHLYSLPVPQTKLTSG